MRLVHLRSRRGHHNVSQHFDREGGCRGGGFVVPFEVSFTFVPRVVGGGVENTTGFCEPPAFTTTTLRFTILVARGRFGAFMTSTSTNSAEVTGPTTISKLRRLVFV